MPLYEVTMKDNPSTSLGAYRAGTRAKAKWAAAKVWRLPINEVRAKVLRL